MAENLAVRFAEMLSLNPFWLKAGPATNTREQVERAFDEGWGGAVWRTVSPLDLTSVTPRVAQPCLGQGGIGTIDPASDRPTPEIFRDMAAVKKKHPDQMLLASIIAEFKAGPWTELAQRAEQAGCDGVEVGLDPYNVHMEEAIGKENDRIRQIVRWVKRAVKVPVVVRLNPGVGNIPLAADTAIKAGADGVMLIDAMRGIMGVDLDALAPTPCVDGFGTFAEYRGPGIKPIALAAVADVARAQPETPICGGGGVQSWNDVVEFLVLGASIVQISTAVLKNGYRSIHALRDGLETYLKEKRKRIGDLRASAINKTVGWDELNLNHNVVAKIDEGRCIGCGKCYVACRDAGYDAISKTVEDLTHHFAVTDACTGCGVCALVCPVMDCVSIVRTGVWKPPRSWKVASSQR